MGNRPDGRGYRSLDVQSVNAEDGANRAMEPSAVVAATDSLEHLRAIAASAELQKKTTDLLLRSEQQKNNALTAELADIRTQLTKEREAAMQARSEKEQVAKQLSSANNQLVQKELQLDQQSKELEEKATENTRLNQLASKQKDSLIQNALKNEELTMELHQVQQTVQNLSEENETLASNSEQLAFDFTQHTIKYRALVSKHEVAEAKANELSLINADLQNSTNTLQLAFEANLQELDESRLENAKLKSELQSLSTDAKCGRIERIKTKLQQRRELLAAAKAVRVAAEARVKTFDEQSINDYATAEKVQARWQKFCQNNDSVVTVLREGEWTEAIVQEKSSSVCWVEYCCDGFTQAVSTNNIMRKRKRPCYLESPPTAKKNLKGRTTCV